MCHVADRAYLISNHCSGDDITLIGSLIWDFSRNVVSWIFLAWWRCADFPNCKKRSLPAQEGEFLRVLIQEFLFPAQPSPACLSSCQAPHPNTTGSASWAKRSHICSSIPTSVTAQNSIPRLISPNQWLVSNQSWLKGALHEDFTDDPCHSALLYVLVSGLICPALISS